MILQEQKLNKPTRSIHIYIYYFFIIFSYIYLYSSSSQDVGNKFQNNWYSNIVDYF